LLSFFHLEAEAIFVAEHDAEDEDRHKPAGLQAVGGKIGAQHRHQRDHRRILLEERPSLVCNEQSGRISERDTGEDADDRLFEQIE
jgi:hypothetical protein